MNLTPLHLNTLLNIYAGSNNEYETEVISYLLKNKLIELKTKSEITLIICENGINELIEASLLKDLIQEYEYQSDEVKKILDNWDEKIDDGLEYTEIKEMLSEVRSAGFTFDYYLDALPFNMVKTPAGW